MRKLPSAFCMKADTLDMLFTPQELAALKDLVDLRFSTPLETFTQASPAELASLEMLITGWGAPALDQPALDLMPNLRYVVHTAGTVKTFIDDLAFARGIEVSSAAAANAVPVAEYTLACIIFGLKRATRFAARLRSTESSAPFRDLDGVPPVGTHRVVIGLVGASQVGRRVVALLKNLDVQILVYDPYLTDHDAEALGVERVGLLELCARSAVVSLHAPASPATYRMIGSEQLSAMANGTVLVNTARGSLVDTVALTAELLAGRLDAFLDVTDPEPLPRTSPLFELPNVFLTPHIAGALGNEVERLGRQAFSEVERIMAGLPLQYPVVADDLSRIA
ncbi:hydroxyacid dehydrogenase [Psychromicrobium xiongbiense]|uniref:hydroxyacid dehydrogenase n=1 Tax=Psychromicrobium xiongbiense TaxID=3051184 RepID=UPI0025574D41|nr:hydroxyacid dehydrogenase [Psychromicrobium sp. YIM S02556]